MNIWSALLCVPQVVTCVGEQGQYVGLTLIWGTVVNIWSVLLCVPQVVTCIGQHNQYLGQTVVNI